MIGEKREITIACGIDNARFDGAPARISFHRRFEGNGEYRLCARMQAKGNARDDHESA
jgi:hypothetical protein